MQPRNLHFEFDGLSEAQLYHDGTRRGFFTVLWREPEPEAFEQFDLGGGLMVLGGGYKQQPRQEPYPLERMAEIIPLLPRDRDTWLSQGEFIRPSRRLVNLARIGLCFVDLDYYQSRYAGTSPDVVLKDVLLYLDDAGLPWPSIVLNSGRGLQLKWLLQNPVPRQALPRWNAVQGVMVSALEEFGADAKAKDASRVLRLVNTVNTKSGSVVEVVYTHEVNGRLAHYTFEELAEAALPLTRRGLDEARRARRQSATVRDSLRIINGGRHGLRRINYAQLNWDRAEDMRTLCAVRWPGGVPEGFRDLVVFLTTVFIAHGGIEPSRLGREAVELAKEFAPTLSHREAQHCVSTVVSKAREAYAGRRVEFNGWKYSPQYTHRNSTLLSLLKIEPAEERQLKTIISKGEKSRRHSERQAERRREAGAVSREDYLRPVAERRVEALRMRQAGFSVRDIAARLGVPPSTVQYYLLEGRKPK